MRDSRNDFEDDAALDLDDVYDATSDHVHARHRQNRGPDPSRFLSEGEFAGLSGGPLLDDEEDDEDEDDVVKVKNPNLSNRLPREDFAPVIEFDDRPPLMERCAEVLKERFKITKMGFLLDGKPANTDKVVAAAGLLFKDEEPIRPSPPTRKRKRPKKF